jgi:glycerophosphoryl diester phosphodiesterase
MKTTKACCLLLALLIATAAQGAEIIAHRGASHDFPENTVAAFQRAWQDGADAVEIDIYLTKDGKIAVIHDKTTKRTTGVALKIADSTLAELQQLDAGTWKGAAWKGERIPTLAQAIATVPSGKRLFIEIKCGPEVLPELGRVIKESGRPAAELVLIGFNYETMQQAKEQFPQLTVYWVGASKKRAKGKIPSIDELISEAKAAHLDGLDLSYHFVLDRAAIARVHQAGLKLFIWTVNDAHVAQALVALGVDGITTDRAGWLRGQLAGGRAKESDSSGLAPRDHPSFVLARSLPAAEARQAAAADTRFVYAVDNAAVAKYDRATGERLAASHGKATHLNSAFLRDGRVYCAHSNFPAKPAMSEILVLDPVTMALEVFKGFGEDRGSLTWAVYHDHHWWCTFAHYGEANYQTVLVKLDDEWNERGLWSYPSEVVKDLGQASISGGIWQGGRLLATGHDRRVIYRLRLPARGDVLELVDVLASPFPGQGIAADPATGGLVGIDRAKKRIVFAELR